MKLNALRDQRNKKVKEARDLVDKAAAENREMTDEEIKRYDAIMGNKKDGIKGEVDKLNEQIERVENLEAVEAEQEQPGNRRVNHQRAGGPEASKDFENLAEFVATIAHNPNDQRLANLYHEYSAEQRMDTGTAGGYNVPTQFRDELFRVEPQEAIIRPRARVIEAGNPPDSAITMPALDQATATNPANVYGGVQVNWTGEGAAVGATDAKFREITLTPKEVTGLITLTEKLLRNWGASASVISTLLRQAVIAAEDDAFLNGATPGKPMGIKGSGAAYVQNRTSAGTILTADIDNMIARMLMRGTGALWVGSQSILPKLLNLVDADGRRIWQPDISGMYPGTLQGRPLVFNERSPILGNKGDLQLIDPRYYLVKDGSGPFVEVGFATGNFESNKRTIKISWNVDGQPWLTEPFKQEGGYQVSPFVVLNTPS